MKIVNAVSTKALTLAVVILGIILASPAGAVSVSYTVGGVGPTQYPGPVTPPANAPWGPNGYPGDTVYLEAYQGLLDLTPGTQVLKINTLFWTIDYTYAGTATDPTAWSDLAFTVGAPRLMSVFNSNAPLAQTGSLQVTWDNDFLSFAPGSTTDFNVSILGMLYVVHVTPLALEPAAGNFELCKDITCLAPWFQPMRDVMAEFVVEAPVPTTPASWGRVKKLYR
jgi:hypothetical protein